MGVYVGLTYFM